MKIHWLISKDNCTKLTINESSIASIRLRAGLFTDQIFKNHEITFGKEIQLGAKKDLIFIGKIGVNQNSLLKKWIEILKNINSKKIIDITDDHFSLRSDNHDLYYFYKEIINNIDVITVSSKKLKSIIESNVVSNKNIFVIPDAVDIEIQPIGPKINQNTLMWFGHPSNLDPLITFIQNYSFDMGINIIVQTSKIGIEYFSHSMKNFTSEKIKIFFSLWTIDNMIKASKASNLIIIPGDLKSNKKLGVSENRLITAFALGLPVAASNYDSYSAFKDYYVDIDNELLLRKLIQDPISFSSKTISAQSKCSKYSKKNIAKSWLDLSERISFL